MIDPLYFFDVLGVQGYSKDNQFRCRQCRVIFKAPEAHKTPRGELYKVVRNAHPYCQDDE